MTKQRAGAFLLVVCGVALLVLAGLTEVRYGLDGLKAVSGRVISADSHKPSRQSGYRLLVTLESEGRHIQLEQEEVGGYAGRLAPGQSIRAWIEAQPRAGDPPAHKVWQIEGGGRVIMPVMAVGDNLKDQMLWEFLGGGFLLLCGLFLIAKHWPGSPDETAGARDEVRT